MQIELFEFEQHNFKCTHLKYLNYCVFYSKYLISHLCSHKNIRVKKIFELNILLNLILIIIIYIFNYQIFTFSQSF